MHVLRLCSVFEVPSHSDLEKLAGFDPIGGMQNHTGELTRALATRSVQQTVITAYRPGVEKRVRSRTWISAASGFGYGAFGSSTDSPPFDILLRSHAIRTSCTCTRVKTSRRSHLACWLGASPKCRSSLRFIAASGTRSCREVHLSGW